MNYNYTYSSPFRGFSIWVNHKAYYEKDLTKEQMHKLIEHHIDFIINGLSCKDKGERYCGIKKIIKW